MLFSLISKLLLLLLQIVSLLQCPLQHVVCHGINFFLGLIIIVFLLLICPRKDPKR